MMFLSKKYTKLKLNINEINVKISPFHFLLKLIYVILMNFSNHLK